MIAIRKELEAIIKQRAKDRNLRVLDYIERCLTCEDLYDKITRENRITKDGWIINDQSEYRENLKSSKHKEP